MRPRRDPRRRAVRPAAAFLLAAPLLASLAACGAPGSANVPLSPAPGGPTQPLRSSFVFFTEDSALLDSDARTSVVDVAALANANPAARVRVRGFTGPAGSPGYNLSLAETRARNVADALRERGVARERIVVEPVGPVPFAASPTESRRVEVVVGG